MSDGPRAPDDQIRIAILGFGRVGRAVLELALTRPWIEVVAVVVRGDERHGEPVRATAPSAPPHLRIRTDAGVTLAEVAPDVVIMATSSRLSKVLPQLQLVLETGVRHVISTSEELAYVLPGDGADAAAIHDLVRTTGATVSATGVNPGFVLDLWPLLLSGLAWDVERIVARRVVDVSVFAPRTRTQLGIGHDRAGFEAGVSAGSIAGHLGFRESLRILCDAMGRPADRITIETEPILAERAYEIVDGTIGAGLSVGVTQRARAWRDGSAWLSIEMLLHVAPEQDGIRTLDEARIHGRHELHATLDPGASAILSTAAQLINSIPTVLGVAPGLYGPGSLPPSAPWLASDRPSRARRPAVAVA